VKEYLRLLFILRFFLRILSFGYPLLLVVMYNFWIFTGLPPRALIAYIAIMGVVELTLVIFSEKSWIGALTKVYAALAIVFEFPSEVLGLLARGQTHGYLGFFGWAFLWYFPVLLILSGKVQLKQ
jgi:hypothetical protein